MIGSAVYDAQNRKIGSVADVILNKDGKFDAVVVDVGSFLGTGGKNVAVAPSELKTDNNRLTLDRSKERLQAITNYDLANRNTGAGTTASPVEGGGTLVPRPVAKPQFLLVWNRAEHFRPVPKPASLYFDSR